MLKRLSSDGFMKAKKSAETKLQGVGASLAAKRAERRKTYYGKRNSVAEGIAGFKEIGKKLKRRLSE